MKMIDVLTKQANKEIEEGTILKVSYYQGLFGKKSVFEFYEDHFFGEEGLEIEELYPLDTDFLNSEVELIPPKEKKYYLRLDKDDNFSYINKNVYFSYEVANKSEHTNYKTKFTQEEIDESMLLKFIEKHGIKEEVEDDEVY